MYSDKEGNSLRDIIGFIDEVQDYAGGMDRDAFSADRRTLRAVESCLQNLTEAAIRVGEARWEALVGTADFYRVRGLGNRLRHEYDRIDALSIYELIDAHLDDIRSACVAALDSR